MIGSGNSSIFMKYRDKLQFLMAGHALRGNSWVGGLQRGGALKSCHTEFHHIIGAAFYKRGTVILVDYRSSFFFAFAGTDCETMIRDAETDDVSREDRWCVYTRQTICIGWTDGLFWKEFFLQFICCPVSLLPWRLFLRSAARNLSLPTVTSELPESRLSAGG